MSDNYMTVRQVAQALGVSRDTVKGSIRRLFPNLMQVGKTTRLTEAQIACISKELKNNDFMLSHITDEESSSVINATTEMEVLANVQQAMNQLNMLYQQKLQEARQLQIELDRDKEWFTVKRVMIETGKEYPWRPLKQYSEANGYDIKKAFDKNYGEVNAYHIEVWNKVYGVEL